MSQHHETAIFLFAHQDDETGVFQHILNEQAAAKRVLCVYLTDGAAPGQSTVVRNQESHRVLSDLGVAQRDILFIGEQLHIGDGELLKHLPKALAWLEQEVLQKYALSTVYVPAWEGGHHDHDALHALGVVAAHRAGCVAKVRQYPLYNGFNCIGPLFRVFVPIGANGQVQPTSVSWSKRVKFLRYCLAYPSQRVTWLGLFPFMFLHYVFWGTQLTQPISVARLKERPHEGPLYYERRKFSTYESVSQFIHDDLLSSLDVTTQNRDQTN